MIAPLRKPALGMLAAVSLLPLAQPTPADEDGGTPLIDKVRAATARYLDINAAFHEGWVAATPCVSGPDTGAMVGVEFIVLAGDWASLHPSGPQPSLDGNLLNYVGAPNRYGLPAFYEIHVWAWERNPKGSYADWNTHVTCEHQGAS